MEWYTYVLILVLTVQCGSYATSPLNDQAMNLNLNGSPNDKKRKRIIGGEQYIPRNGRCATNLVTPDFEHWMASIKSVFRVKPRRIASVCGGALISDQHILTALHCITNPYDNFALVPMDNVEIYFDIKNVEVFKGAMFKPLEYFYVDMPDDPPKQMTHTIEGNETKFYKDDIAVIKLDRPINEIECPGLKAIPIMTRLGIPGPNNYWIAGWGRTRIDSNERAQFLKYTDKIPKISCPDAPDERIFPTNICFKNTNLLRTHKGDSGSPRVVAIKGIWHIQGVLSRAIKDLVYGTSTNETLSVDINVYHYRHQIAQWRDSYRPTIMNKFDQVLSCSVILKFGTTLKSNARIPPNQKWVSAELVNMPITLVFCTYEGFRCDPYWANYGTRNADWVVIENSEAHLNPCKLEKASTA